MTPPPRTGAQRLGWVGAALLASALTLAIAAGLRLRSGPGAGPGRAARAEAAGLVDRGVAALRQDSLEAARGYFEAALARDPGNGQALENIGIVYLNQRDTTRAAEYFRQVVERGLGDAKLRAAAHYNLGGIDMRAGAWTSAIEQLTRATALAPDDARYRTNLASALIRAGRAAEARAVLDTALTRLPGTAVLHENAALADYQLGDLGAARREADRAIDLDPGLAAARGLRARVRAAAGDRQGAWADWNAYVHLGPQPGERAEVESDLRDKGVLPPS